MHTDRRTATDASRWVFYILMQTASRDSICSNRGDVAVTGKHRNRKLYLVATLRNRYKIRIEYSMRLYI